MTGKMINANGIPIMMPNDITNDTNEFYISYNDRDIHVYGDVTTALVSYNPTKFLILYGNHTEQYNQIILNNGTYKDCVKYFRDNQSLKAKYSENWDEKIIFKDGRLFVTKDDRMKLDI